MPSIIETGTDLFFICVVCISIINSAYYTLYLLYFNNSKSLDLHFLIIASVKGFVHTIV